ncbi:DUF4160 domain-containing protein [Azovibrio sp.]|uniref:DUF4160 domain-containing protein n=1 Tax=Azovibrio sp. TaxID=1872673 RepID=UPI003C77ED06
MYLDDHPPPHVHVKLKDGRDCTVDLDDFAIKGRVTEREICDALAWTNGGGTIHERILFPETDGGRCLGALSSAHNLEHGRSARS